MFRTPTAIALTLSTALAAAVMAADDEQAKVLTIGDAAPKLDVEHWVKGDAVEKFKDDNIYVVEFWATWCGPCLAGMPHLSELQEKYRDYGVSILGISDEPLETVTTFLAREDREGTLWNDKTRYTVATDPDRSVFNDYMRAAGQNGIPTAFVVGKTGKVEWIGHPMAMDDVLDALVRDDWDRDAFKEEFAKEQAEALKAAQAQRKLREAHQAEDWPQVLAILDEMIKDSEGNLGWKVQKFTVLLTAMDEPDRAYAYGDTLVSEHWDHAHLLNHIAWMVADDSAVKVRDLDFAMKVAQRANELTEQADASILDTLARVHYEKGDLEQAIAWQRRSVAASEDDSAMAEHLAQTLRKYEQEASEKQ